MDFDAIIPRAAGVAAGSGVADVLEQRAELMALSEAAHDAVLTPGDPGGLSHAQRAALACRMARINADETLGAHYRSMLDAAQDGADLAEVSAPSADPDSLADPRLVALVRHIDLLTREPRSATRQSIEDLKAAGVDEADIVRLSELAAFVNYQVRVVAGLRLLEGHS